MGSGQAEIVEIGRGYLGPLERAKKAKKRLQKALKFDFIDLFFGGGHVHQNVSKQ